MHSYFLIDKRLVQVLSRDCVKYCFYLIKFLTKAILSEKINFNITYLTTPKAYLQPLKRR